MPNDNLEPPIVLYTDELIILDGEVDLTLTPENTEYVKSSMVHSLKLVMQTAAKLQIPLVPLLTAARKEIEDDNSPKLTSFPSDAITHGPSVSQDSLDGDGE